MADLSRSQQTSSNHKTPDARPFLKWAGGKGQLLPAIDARLPARLRRGQIRRYIEPFVGGGALFFHVRRRYLVQEWYLSDRNPELILAYRTLQCGATAVIEQLSNMAAEYTGRTARERKRYYYDTRAHFNDARTGIDHSQFDTRWIERTAQIIFLNRTCYNGLFRVNASGAFNVPHGRYKNPRICDAENLQAVAQALANVEIRCGHFTTFQDLVDESTFVYFDPPYRPISRTANFTAYSRHTFDDEAQLALASYFRALHERGAALLLSNSDPYNEDPGDDFFVDAYAGFTIQRVPASRNINSRGDRRGPIRELLIMNYEPDVVLT